MIVFLFFVNKCLFVKLNHLVIIIIMMINKNVVMMQQCSNDVFNIMSVTVMTPGGQTLR